MISCKLKNRKAILLKVDSELFNENIITKALYWCSNNYIISQKKQGKIITLKFEKQNGVFSAAEYSLFESRISQDLIDFKTRDIVNTETRSVREILLIKAFANNDNFEDYNLIAGND